MKYISLVNLIMDKQVVTELIQDDLTTENVRKELGDILYNPQKREAMGKDYRALKHLLQEKEGGSARAAQEIVGFLESKNK